MKPEKQKKILILVGGNVSKLDSFKPDIDKFGIDVTLGTFSDINYNNMSKSGLKVKLRGVDLKQFDIIYIRMIGKRLEDAAIVVQYAKKNNMKIVDHLYENELLHPSSVSKAVETKKLIEAGIPMPKTFYGSLEKVMEIGKSKLGYPFCIKSTSGRKAREVWIIENDEDYAKKAQELLEFEKNGMRFFCQAFVKTSQRIRVMTIGGKASYAITRPTKWRGRVTSSLTKTNPDGVRGKLDPIPFEYKTIAEKAAKAVELDICGVDILHEDDTKNIYVIEANAAPAWKLIEKDWKIDMEEIILKWLVKSRK